MPKMVIEIDQNGKIKKVSHEGGRRACNTLILLYIKKADYSI
jgi:hypothetical protein